MSTPRRTTRSWELVRTQRYNDRGSGSTDVLRCDWPPDIVDEGLYRARLYVNNRLREYHSPVGLHNLLWWLPMVLYGAGDGFDATGLVLPVTRG